MSEKGKKIQTKDKDFVDAASDAGYTKLEKGEKIEISGQNWKVIAVAHEKSGMDAVCLENPETGERIIVYRGTEMGGSTGQKVKDSLADGRLFEGGTPEQAEDAKKFYDKMNKKAKEDRKVIAGVTGNSLGGGLANEVAEKFGVRSVTLNPSMSSKKGLTGKGDITNYVTTNDPLYRAMKAANLLNRLPGDTVFADFEGGTDAGINHVGKGKLRILKYKNGKVVYLEDPKELKKKKKKDPNAVDMKASDLIPFAIWGDGMLTSENVHGELIEIDSNHMKELEDRLKTSLTDMEELLVACLDPVYEIYRDEGNKLGDRKTKLADNMEEIFDSKLYSGIKKILDVYDVVGQAKKSLLLIAHFAARDVEGGLDTLFSEANYTQKVNRMINSFDKSYKEAVPELLKGVSGNFFGTDDGFIKALKKHHKVMDNNLHAIMENWKSFGEGVRVVHTVMKETDRQLKAGFDENKVPAATISPEKIPAVNSTKEESSVFEEVQKAVDEKEEILNTNFKNFANIASVGLSQLGEDLGELSGNICKAIKTLSKVARTAIKMAADAYPQPKDGASVDAWKNWQKGHDNLVSQADEIDKVLKELEDIIEEVFKKAAKVLEDNSDEVLESFKPYIWEAIFQGNNYSIIQQQCAVACNELRALELSFDQVGYQLSQQKFKALTELGDRANIMKNQFHHLYEQLEIVLI